MKQIKILSLALSHFKGIDSLFINFNGASAALYGVNAAGKTTVLDAWSWLVTGADSCGRAPGKGFDILELEDGVPTGAEASVEAEVWHGLLSTTLKKVYRQKLTRSAGEVTARSTGHTTDHWVDGVPRSQWEYNAVICEIVGEPKQWRLLMGPLNFSEELPWKARRRLLLDITGGVADADVVAAGVDFGPLLKVLETRSFDDHRAILTARKADLTKERKKIPVRIDEVRRKTPVALPLKVESGTTGLVDEAGVLSDLAQLREDRMVAEADRQRVDTGGEVAAKTEQRSLLRAKILTANNEAQEAASEGAEGLLEEWEKVAQQESVARIKVSRIESGQKDRKELARFAPRRLVELESAWGEADAEVFEHDDEDTCASCGHALAPEKVEAARARALGLFNASKAERLQVLAADIDHEQMSARQLKAIIEGEDVHLRAAITNLARAGAVAMEAKKAAKATSSYETPAAVLRLQAEEMALDLEIKALKDDSSEALGVAAAKVASLDQSIEGAEATIAKFDQRRQAETRIEELKAQEKDLARQAGDAERGLWLAGQFTRAKVRLVEEQVDQHFELARFRLFRKQVKRGPDGEDTWEDVCDVLGPDGVPFGSGLNGAGRIKVGLDIIATLQKHFGVSLPVWADDAMLIFDFPPMDCQVIRLVGSEADETLRIEKE